MYVCMYVCNGLLHRNSNMDLKMHVYSVPLRSPFVFPRVPWYFEVRERIWPEIRGGGTAFPRVLLHLTTDSTTNMLFFSPNRKASYSQ